jgi:hypothetical protein
MGKSWTGSNALVADGSSTFARGGCPPPFRSNCTALLVGVLARRMALLSTLLDEPPFRRASSRRHTHEWPAEFRSPITAIGDECIEQGAHLVGGDGIINKAAVPPRGDKTDAGQNGQMRAHGRRRDTQTACDLSGGKPFGSAPHKQSEDAQPRGVRDGGEAIHDLTVFHISSIAVASERVKPSAGAGKRSK